MGARRLLAVALCAALACIDGPAAPEHLGELRIRAVFAPGEAPAELSLAVQTIRVVVARDPSGPSLVDTTLVWTDGATLAWLLELAAAAEHLAVRVSLAGGGVEHYAGHPTLTIQDAPGPAAVQDVLVRHVGPRLTSITIAPGQVTLGGLAETVRFTAMARDATGATMQGVILAWTSEDPAIATVDATGLATAVGPGTTGIVATAAGVSGTASLTVRPTNVIVVTPGAAALAAAGETQQFHAQAFDAGGLPKAGVTYAWSSNDPAVASVDPVSGLATAVGFGTATIRATDGELTGSATLRIARVVSITVSPDPGTLVALADTTTFTATARDDTGQAIAGLRFAWSSADPAVAGIDPASGRATAFATGTTLVAAAAGGQSGRAALTVRQDAAQVTVSPAVVSLSPPGASHPFTAIAQDATGHGIPGAVFQWSSADPVIATVHAATGVVTSHAVGSTTIAATSGGATGTATLRVAHPVASVVVTPGSASLAIGAQQALAATARDANGQAIAGATFRWSSSRPAVATVDPQGLVTVHAAGTATITATSEGVSGSATVDAGAVATISIAPGASTLTALGATQAHTATARDATGAALTGVTFTWSSSAPAVATADAATGLVTAVANGAATITASAGGKAGTATVTVQQAVASVTVSPATASLAAYGATQAYAATARDANGHPVAGVAMTWTTGNPAVASVTQAGTATSTGPGTTTVRATSGTVTGSASLQVLVPAIASITVTPATAHLAALGQVQPFTAVARDASGAVIPNVPFAWSGNAPAVAAVDPATGTATASANGTAQVTAAAGGTSGSAALTVQQAVTGIDVTPAAATLAAYGATQAFAATARDANGHPVAGVSFTWSSADPAVATVDAQAGLATVTGPGMTGIMATGGGLVGTGALTAAVPAVASVIITPSHAVVKGAGATFQFTAMARDAAGQVIPGVAFSWTSSKPQVATVSQQGLTTATGPGSTVLTATAGGRSGIAELLVQP